MHQLYISAMKTLSYILILGACTVTFISCKKNEVAPSVDANENTLDLKTTATAALTVNSFKITTIAGSAFKDGLVDGIGKQSRLYNPIGIDLAADGYLYVADAYNHKIRKISPVTNAVSTINIPNASDGSSISYPAIVRVSKDGTLNMMANEPHTSWILKTNGTVLTPDHTPDAQIPSDLERDPSNNFFWMAEINSKVVNGQHVQKAYLKKFYINDITGLIGTSPLKLPADSIEVADRNDFNILTFYPGYNGVKYVVINYTKLYKLTPSGSFVRIYKDLKFNEIHSIVSSKDSRTLYLVESGSIKCIANGVHKFLAGPNSNYHDGRDGVGSTADIYAEKLVLSKDENTLYFTDSYTSTVRKMQLK